MIEEVPGVVLGVGGGRGGGEEDGGMVGRCLDGDEKLGSAILGGLSSADGSEGVMNLNEAEKAQCFECTVKDGSVAKVQGLEEGG